MTSADPHGQKIDWEATLVERACRGDRRAFERLYREHVGRVHGLCLRLSRCPADADDRTQQTFINAWQALPRFERRSSFATWLHRIAVNVVLSARPAADHRWVDAAVHDDCADTANVVFDSPVEVEEIEVAIRELPDGARDVLVLSGIYGYSHAEAAALLGIAEGTCRAQLHRARHLLKKRLDMGN